MSGRETAEDSRMEGKGRRIPIRTMDLTQITFGERKFEESCPRIRFDRVLQAKEN